MKIGALIMVLLLVGPGWTATASTTTDGEPQKGIEAAKAITKITGVAISPLLGAGGIGAFEWATTPRSERASLPWYAHIQFWLPALLLVGAVACKDVLGTAIPPGLKKPLDVAETVENKVSGLVMAGALVPMIGSIFGPFSSGDAAASGVAGGMPLCLAGLASFNWSALLNIFTVPLAVAAYALVWLAGHAINVLILLSPFGAVDAALKAFRTSLLSLVAVTSFANPVAGAVLSLIVIVIAYFLAGWSLRLTVFGTIYVWDFFTRRHGRFRPAANGNWMFTARRIEKTPIRTYGRLVKTDQGALAFAYRPWLVRQKRTQALPAGRYAVGRGLFSPEIMRLEGEGEAEREQTLLILPPRYRTHEAEMSAAYSMVGVRDVGLRRGFKAIWRWVKGLFGFRAAEQRPAPSPA